MTGVSGVLGFPFTPHPAAASKSPRTHTTAITRNETNLEAKSLFLPFNLAENAPLR